MIRNGFCCITTRPNVRQIHKSARAFARFTKVSSDVKPNVKKPTRQDKIDKNNMLHQGKLYHLDNEFHIFNDKVTKVLDLGYVPGNWLSFAKFKLCDIYQLSESRLADKCHLLGFDILFATPPTGTSTIQGNIFSQSSHQLIANHFRNFALQQALKQQELGTSSYFDNELVDSLVTEELEELAQKFDQVRVTDNKTEVNSPTPTMKKLDFKPELILSDLSSPFMQERGFFNNTNTRPYFRFSSNEVLRQPIINKTKSAIDMADATLVLACDLLKVKGTLVIRMAQIDKRDPEITVIIQRLHKVFAKVTEWNMNNASSDLFLVCQEKKQDVIDKRMVFSR